MKLLLCNITQDKNILLNILKGSIEWNNSQELKKFNPQLYIKDLLKEHLLEDILFSFNYFNSIMKIKTYLYNTNDLLSYLEKAKKYFFKKGVDIERKLLSKVSERLNENLTYITPYINYNISIENSKCKIYSRNNKLNRLLEIEFLEYLDFF